MNHQQHQPLSPKRYFIRHRNTREQATMIATNAQDACRKLGWLIGYCIIERVESLQEPLPGIFTYRHLHWPLD